MEGNFQGLAFALSTSLKHLQLGSAAVTDDVVETIASRCPHVTYLDLSQTGITSDSLKHVAAHCKLLTTFRACETGIDDHGVKALIYNCDFIEVLDFYHCQNLTDLSSHATGRHCSTLVYISFHRCPLVTDRFTEAIIDNNPHLINVSYDINWGTSYGLPYHRLFPQFFKQ